MIITQLIGGLGNQMFQYAFGRTLALERKSLLKVDTSLLKEVKKRSMTPRDYNLNIFRAPIEFLDIEADGLMGQEVILVEERKFGYDNELLEKLMNLPNDLTIVLQGYWQSSKYFDKYRIILKEHFRPEYGFHGIWKKMAKRIGLSESVLVHVRRGDYLMHLDHHGVVSQKYLLNAMEMVKMELPNAMFFIFSDDIAWCRENIPKAEDVIFVNECYYDAGCRFYFQLMSLCKHFIIANSTFSWWAAYLGERKGSTIIVPDPWFSSGQNSIDLIPSNWIRIDK